MLVVLKFLNSLIKAVGGNAKVMFKILRLTVNMVLLVLS